jgi:hypothetical protein
MCTQLQFSAFSALKNNALKAGAAARLPKQAEPLGCRGLGLGLLGGEGLRKHAPGKRQQRVPGTRVE